MYYHLAHMLRFVLFLVDYILMSSTVCDLDLFFEIYFLAYQALPKLMVLENPTQEPVTVTI